MNVIDDPYNDRKVYHLGDLWSEGGDVSPLCAEEPRKIDLRRELWTIVENAVTCKKCLAKMKELGTETEHAASD